MVIRIDSRIQIDEGELAFRFIRSSGPGGQNVNKVATAVQLRFDVANSPALSAEVRARLVRLAGRRVGADGVLTITARRFRSQERNRQDAVDRLVDLVRRAAHPPPPRRRTRPPARARETRLREKQRRGETKRKRRAVPPGTE